MRLSTASLPNGRRPPSPEAHSPPAGRAARPNSSLGTGRPNPRLAGFLVCALLLPQTAGSEKSPFSAESSLPGLSTVRFEELTD
jgi:hypothetical protein